jgi:glycosyltransferase involved in cell wall biosynthesis
MTASLGLLEYAKRVGVELKVIDTTQSSFPVPAFTVRLKKGLSRLRELASLNRQFDIRGCIIFSSAGFSFYERIAVAFLCRLLAIKTMLFVRSGHFMDEVRASKIRRLFARLLLRVPTVIGAQGEKWRQFYEALGISEDKVTVVQNWLPPKAQIAEVKGIVHAPIRFIFVGWLVKKKGVVELLEACDILNKQGLKFELTLVGGGDLLEFSKEYVNDHGLGNFTRVVGWKEQEQVQDLLLLHDVFILPSQAEGFPNAMLEAMAAGLPSIVTDVGSVSDSLSNDGNGFLLPSGVASEIADAMAIYIDKPLKVLEHSAIALETLKNNHDYEINCRKLFSFFGLK